MHFTAPGANYMVADWVISQSNKHFIYFFFQDIFAFDAMIPLISVLSSSSMLDGIYNKS